MDELLQADQARYAAMRAGDLSALADMLAEELSYTHSSGLSESKTQYLNSLGSGRFVYLKTDTQDVLVQWHGEQVAAMHGKVVLEVRIDGTPRTLHNRFLTVWSRRAGRWQLAAWASTPLPLPEAAPSNA